MRRERRKAERRSRGIAVPQVWFWAWFFRILLILNLVPLAAIAFYAHPGADDFAFSNYPHHAWEASHSIAAFFGGCARQFHWNYFSWQGCYSAVILGTLDPLAFGEQYYVLVPYLLAGFLVLSNFVFWRTAAFHLTGAAGSGRKDVLDRPEGGVPADGAFPPDEEKRAGKGTHRRKAPQDGNHTDFRALGDSAASIACLAEIELVPRAFDMFFWWDGAVNYLPFFCCLLLMGAILIRYADEGRLSAGLTALAALLSFAFVGGNYSTALMNFLMLVLAGLFLLKALGERKAGKPRGIPYLVILAAGILGFLVSILAPGNSARVADEGAAGITSVPACILTSIRLAVDSVQDNLSLLLVLFLAMAAPFLWKMSAVSGSAGLTGCEDTSAEGIHAGAAKRTAGERNLPLPLILTALFLVYAAGFSPSVYVYGDGGPMRLEDVRFFYLVFFLLLAEYETLRRFRAASGTGSREKRAPGCGLTRYMTGVLLLAVLLTGTYYVIPRENRERLTSLCAARSVLIGEARRFDAQMKAREAVLNDPSTDGQDVTVQAVTDRPKLLFLLGLEMEEDPENWINRTVAVYYDKRSVTLDSSNLPGEEQSE